MSTVRGEGHEQSRFHFPLLWLETLLRLSPFVAVGAEKVQRPRRWSAQTEPLENEPSAEQTGDEDDDAGQQESGPEITPAHDQPPQPANEPSPTTALQPARSSVV
jgi:hypothetical protein